MSVEAEWSVGEAQTKLEELANAFLRSSPSEHPRTVNLPSAVQSLDDHERYRSLVEQLPAVVFMAHLDRGISEAYVSPHIEATLGFSQAEWLEDPVRWYRQIHPEDNLRWSLEAAEMFLTGKPLRSVYRVIARDGHVVWFHCEAKMLRRDDGQPFFVQGVAFDITDLKQTEEALQQERNFISAILNTVGTLILVLDPEGRIVQFNRACEHITGKPFDSVRGAIAADLFLIDGDRERFENALQQLCRGRICRDFEAQWENGDGAAHLIGWSGTILPEAQGRVRNIILTGIDITESKRLEKAILEISGREERRIGQDLHDGLGQHLTGIAFMSKVLAKKLADKSPAEAAEANKIVRLVNEAVHKTRELSRGLLPVVADARGLMSALEHYASEVEDLFGISCRFECDLPVLIYDDPVANHLYRIAQEAVNNAIKHGDAQHVAMRLYRTPEGLTLNIHDDGRGLPSDARNSTGMGLHIMNYRAKMIGAALQVTRGTECGTSVTCTLPSLRNGAETN
ncbi:MAG: PAS domain S-box protein [Bryobacteraceae bacterium]|jgi:PAS domain S-box-containing protein